MNGVAGGERGDIGAGDDRAASLGDKRLQLVDGFEGRRAERQVGRRSLLARSTERPIEQYRPIAALHTVHSPPKNSIERYSCKTRDLSLLPLDLNEAVVEVEAQQAGGDADVALEQLLQVAPDDGLQVGAGRLVEGEGEALHERRVDVGVRRRGDEGDAGEDEEEVVSHQWRRSEIACSGHRTCFNSNDPMKDRTYYRYAIKATNTISRGFDHRSTYDADLPPTCINPLSTTYASPGSIKGAQANAPRNHSSTQNIQHKTIHLADLTVRGIESGRHITPPPLDHDLGIGIDDRRAN
ncbi:hypothetical protein BHM03_00058142 [Ensete ventricosum]|nr:hypothetical protein BHM03_00058142 [Ensete ventricosum]